MSAYKKIAALVFVSYFLFAFFVLIRNSPGVSADSVLYLSVANNIADIGYPVSPFSDRKTPVFHPPLYVYLLAVFKSVGVDALAAVRIINSLCFAIFATLVFKFLYLVFDSNSNLLFKTLMIITFSEIMIYPFVMAWTEPIFIPLTLAVLFSLFKYIETESLIYYILALFCSALALLTRYAAAPLIISGSVFLFCFLNKRKIRWRLFLSATFFILSILPTVIWLIQTLKALEFSSVRKFGIHPISVAHFRQLVRTILFIFFPNEFLDYLKQAQWLQFLFGILITSLFFIVVLFLLRELKQYGFNLKTFFIHMKARLSTAQILLFGFSFVYFVFLIFSISFFDFNTPLDYRICSPGFAPLIMGFSMFLPKIQRDHNKKLIFIMLNIFCCVILYRVFLFAIKDCEEGFGFTSKIWRESEAIEIINAADCQVYSNSPEGIYFTTGKMTKDIPSKIYRHTGFSDKSYEYLFSRLLSELKRPEKAIMIVYFRTVPSCGIPTHYEFLEQVMPDKKIETSNAIILYYARKD